mmetsp:Transcript_15717/g.24138  ORF Transcript_15717/g.24138 Transcript_15717/m.24138 type:complete len:110 (+) Transcript_15717:1237-1566(+)
MDHIHELKELKDVKKQICTVEGSWLKNLYIDGKKYWDVDELVPKRQQYLLEKDGMVMPSDWRYREDLIWLKYGYTGIAQQWKLRLEVQQRHDRSLRNKFNKKLGKHHHH